MWKNRNYISLSILTFLSAISLLPYFKILSHEQSFGDEGLIAQSAYRIFNGDIPFKDFFTAITPGSYYFYASFLKLFSPSFVALRFGAMIVALATIITVWKTFQKSGVISISYYIFATAFLSYFGSAVWFVASHHWLANLLSLISLLLLMPNIEDETPSPLNTFIAGFFTTLAIFTLQHRGGIWFITSITTFFFIEKSKRIRLLTYYLSGAAALAAPILIYFASTAGFDTIFYDLVTFPATQYSKIASHGKFDIHPVEMLQRYFEVFNFISKPDVKFNLLIMTFGLFGMFFVYAAPFYAIFSIGLLIKEKRLHSYRISLLAAALLASYISTIHRIHDTTLFFASPTAVAIIAISTALSKENKIHNLSIKIFTAIFIIISVGYSLQMQFRPKTVFNTAAGSIETFFSAEKKTFSEFNRFISFARIKSGDTVFAYPYNPMLYFLYQLKNPTEFDILTYPMHTDDQLKQGIKKLEASKCRWIILDSYQKDELSKDISIENYFMQNFELKMSSPYIAILERNSINEK